MLVVITDVRIRPEAVDDFKRWFSESNGVLSKFGGFVSRRLLESGDGRHRIMVEFEDMEKFTAMRQSPEHERLHSEAVRFMDGAPSPTLYRVVAQ